MRLTAITLFFLLHQVLSSVVLAPDIFAQELEQNEQAGFILEPAFQEVEIDSLHPTVQTTFSLENTTQQAESFEVFSVEFPSTQHFGSLNFIDFGQSAIKQQPSYMTFDAQQFVVNPHEKREIVVRVTNRANLKPGGTYTAVVVRTIQKDKTEDQVVLPAFASLFLIRKSEGEIRNISISAIEESTKLIRLSFPNRIAVTFQNNGNVHLIPRGQVLVKDSFKRVIKQGIINEESTYVYPDTQKVIYVDMHKSRMTAPIMIMTVVAQGSSEDSNYVSEYSFIYVSPIFLAILVAVFFLIMYKRKKRKKKKKYSVEIHLQKDEQPNE